MRFDPEYPGWAFSTEKMMQKSVVRQIIQANYARHRQMKANEPKKPAWVTALLIILIFVVVAGVFISAAASQPLAAVALFGCVFIVLGLKSLITGKTGTPMQRGLLVRGSGLILILLGLCVIVPVLLSDRIGKPTAFIVMGGALFTAAGLFATVYAIRTAYHSRADYGLPVDACCIGYVHKIVSSRHSSHVESAEVFEYDYEGEHYRAVNSIFRRTPSAEVGDYAELRINPNMPDEFYYSGSKSNTLANFIGILFSAVFVAAGCFLLWGALSGRLTIPQNDERPRTQTEPVPQVSEIDDSQIQQQIGADKKDWEVGLYKVLDKKRIENDYVAFFSGRLPVSCTKDVYDLLKEDAEYILITDSDCENVYWILPMNTYIYSGEHIVNDFRGQK